MATISVAPLRARLERALARIVELKPGEFAGLAASFVYFFALLTCYYIVRPIREEMGTMLRGLDENALKYVFVIVFLVMLAAVPVFGLVVTRFEKRRVVPIVYGFFIANLLGFWLVFSRGAVTPTLAKAYFVWVSVFNLFVISLFWSVMASNWRTDQAKRLYGVIAAGGTAGSLMGPILTSALARIIGPTHLLLVAAAFLILALAIALALPRLFGDTSGAHDEKKPVTLASVLEGARRVFENPFLFRIALWVFLANLLSTYFYAEQAAIVSRTIADRTARVELFARIDLAVSVLTMLAQVFGTARIIERLGLGATVAALPLAALVGFVLLWASPTLAVIVVVMVLERAVHFSFSNPASRVLWTGVDPDDKYKAQNFVDTVVYRGGDAASGYFFDALGKAGLGLGPVGTAAVVVPMVAGWAWLSFDLARRSEIRPRAAAMNGK
jgi:AAA family ATP:ADP antiporter